MQEITINRDELDFHAKESYNALRTNIEFSGKKVISVTSCMPNEGKSSVSVNLAQSFAELGKKVILIDADMRKSVLINRYNIKNGKKGLSHYLSGQCEMKAVLSSTNAENFYMILSGPVPPNPSELLSSERFSGLLNSLKKEYDYIIIDCPPKGNVVDALIAGKLSDGVVLVIASGQISYKFAKRIKKQLEDVGCSIIGVVLNKVHMKRRGYYGRYYGGYYSYYGNDGKL